MPQLDVSTFAPQIIWLAISFAVLYGLMAWVGLPRIGGIIAKRQRRIEGDIATAAQMKAEAETVIAAYERALSEARAEAQAVVRTTTERLNEAAAQRQRKLAETLAAETQAAEQRIAAAKSVALAGLRDMAVEVARAAAARIAGTELGLDRARAAVEDVMRERAQ